MIRKGDVNDPKGLIFEAFRIEGITESECRTIFLDWALSLSDGLDTIDTIGALLEKYNDMDEAHPMLGVLREGRAATTKPRRRGGWRSRNRAN